MTVNQASSRSARIFHRRRHASTSSARPASANCFQPSNRKPTRCRRRQAHRDGVFRRGIIGGTGGRGFARMGCGGTHPRRTGDRRDCAEAKESGERGGAGGDRVAGYGRKQASSPRLVWQSTTVISVSSGSASSIWVARAPKPAKFVQLRTHPAVQSSLCPTIRHSSPRHTEPWRRRVPLQCIDHAARGTRPLGHIRVYKACATACMTGCAR